MMQFIELSLFRRMLVTNNDMTYETSDLSHNW